MARRKICALMICFPPQIALLPQAPRPSRRNKTYIIATAITRSARAGTRPISAPSKGTKSAVFSFILSDSFFFLSFLYQHRRSAGLAYGVQLFFFLLVLSPIFPPFRNTTAATITDRNHLLQRESFFFHFFFFQFSN